MCWKSSPASKQLLANHSLLLYGIGPNTIQTRSRYDPNDPNTTPIRRPTAFAKLSDNVFVQLVLKDVHQLDDVGVAC